MKRSLTPKLAGNAYKMGLTTLILRKMNTIKFKYRRFRHFSKGLMMFMKTTGLKMEWSASLKTNPPKGLMKIMTNIMKLTKKEKEIDLADLGRKDLGARILDLKALRYSVRIPGHKDALQS